MEDVKAREFADDLFLYLFHKTKLIKRLPSSRGSKKIEFKEKIGQSVLYFTYTYHDLCKRFLHSFLENIMQSKENFVRYLKLYCCSHKYNQNIFDKFLNSCSFLLEMVLFCRNEGDDGFIFFAPICWVEFFECELRNEFYLEGGWQELENYINFKGYASHYKTSAKKIERFFVFYGEDEHFPTIFKDGSAHENLSNPDEERWNDAISGDGNSTLFREESNSERSKLFVAKIVASDSGDTI
ncbi:hypothetical protein HNY73_019127 [Argiope bruennichi]|uniref:Uncharacterized protein n=1 Tax=Argiope bruennichi TaxID=94029 RepID=A0A8T0EF58_ARGBR|nr:hypothetical protein HNY73_019127 [Argiope bruennichi]